MNFPLRWPKAAIIIVAAIACGFARAQEPSESMNLWADKPPGFVEGAGEEITGRNGYIEKVSVPAISVFLPAKEKSTGMALIVCPGGSYRLLNWNVHVLNVAQYFNSKGIAVIGLKYRTSPPYMVNKNDRGIPLRDLQRAVRVVRSNASKWNINPHRIGVLGYSAGANLVMTLASAFNEGDAKSGDPVERLSCRPDFVVACSVWHFHETASPFAFPQNAPPVFMVHATDDRVAPIELPYAIKKQLEDLGVPVHLEVYNEGGHGVGHLSPQRVQQNYPPAKWPEEFLKWIASLDPAME